MLRASGLGFAAETVLGSINSALINNARMLCFNVEFIHEPFAAAESKSHSAARCIAVSKRHLDVRDSWKWFVTTSSQGGGAIRLSGGSAPICSSRSGGLAR